MNIFSSGDNVSSCSFRISFHEQMISPVYKGSMNTVVPQSSLIAGQAYSQAGAIAGAAAAMQQVRAARLQVH